MNLTMMYGTGIGVDFPRPFTPTESAKFTNRRDMNLCFFPHTYYFSGSIKQPKPLFKRIMTNYLRFTLEPIIKPQTGVTQKCTFSMFLATDAQVFCFGCALVKVVILYSQRALLNVLGNKGKIAGMAYQSSMSNERYISNIDLGRYPFQL